MTVGSYNHPQRRKQNVSWSFQELFFFPKCLETLGFSMIQSVPLIGLKTLLVRVITRGKPIFEAIYMGFNSISLVLLNDDNFHVFFRKNYSENLVDMIQLELESVLSPKKQVKIIDLPRLHTMSLHITPRGSLVGEVLSRNFFGWHTASYKLYFLGCLFRAKGGEVVT